MSVSDKMYAFNAMCEDDYFMPSDLFGGSEEIDYAEMVKNDVIDAQQHSGNVVEVADIAGVPLCYALTLAAGLPDGPARRAV